MALELTFPALEKAVGYIMGWDPDSANWSADETALGSEIVQSGLRQFYSPPLLPNQSIAHEWTFLRPVTTLTTSAAYSTGTIAVASGVVTLTGGTFPSWAADGDLTVSGSTYEVSTRDGNTQVTLVDTSVTVSSGATYSLSRGVYSLPSDYGTPDGPMTYQAGDGLKRSITNIPESKIRMLRQDSFQVASWPRYFAVRPKTTTGTAAQGWEAIFWPNATAAYVLEYRYFAITHSLDDTNLYAYGGALHSETILASVRAEAELRRDDARGAYYQQFMERLGASIAHDRRMQPDTFGKNTCREDDPMEMAWDNTGVTYNGVLYGS